MPPDVPLSDEVVSRIDAACDCFEMAWRIGQPRLEDTLDQAPEVERSFWLRALLEIELEVLRTRGATPDLDAYLTRFPNHEDVIRATFDPTSRLFAVAMPQNEAEPAGPVEKADRHRLPPLRYAARFNCPHCQNPIEIVADSVDEEVICPSCGSSLNLDTGRSLTWNKQRLPQIAQFELLEAVGRGAFGTVYKARDHQLQRLVAIKIPRSGVLETDEDEDRFVREARNAAQLRHPGIVAIHSVGRSDTFPYLVSEFAEGVTLAQYLTAKRFSMQDGAKLIRDIAFALQHAHEQGIVHRDLKPSNIMLAPDGSPRLMDFGCAKRDAGEITMTLDGQILGTPAYMSPEQARGHAHQADARSDIYSVGVILFQLLTGELPFRGDVRMLLYQVLHDEPPSPRKFNGQIPRDLDTICLKCLAKEPKRRYASASELADDLQRYLDGHPILSRPVGRFERAWRWCRRNPAVAGLTSLAAFMLVLTTVVSSVAYVRESRLANRYAQLNVHLTTAKTDAETKRAEAEASAKIAREQSQLALNTLQSVINDLQRAFENVPGGAAVRQRLLAIALEKLDQVSTEFVAQSAVDHNTVIALLTMADTIQQLGQDSPHSQREESRLRDDAANARPLNPITASAVRTAERLYRRAFEIAQQLVAANPGDSQAQRNLSVTFDRLGGVFLKLGRTDDALGQFQAKLKIDRALIATDPKRAENQRNLSISFELLGDVLLKLGRTPDALAEFQDSLKIRRLMAEADPRDAQKQRDLSVSFVKFGDVFLTLGRTDDALQQFQDALKIRRVLAEADPHDAQMQRDLSAALNSLGEVFLKLGRTDDALAQFQDGLTIRRALAEADPHDTRTQSDLADSFDNLANAFLKLGRTLDVLAQYESMVQICRGQAEADPHDTNKQLSLSAALERLGEVFVTLGRTDDALQQFESCQKIIRALAEADPHNVTNQGNLSASFNNLGEVFLKLGRTDDALAQFQDALQIRRALAEADPRDARKQRDLWSSLIHLGDMFQALGRTTDAQAQFQDAMKIIRMLTEADPNNMDRQLDLSLSFERLGDVFLTLGRTTDALSQFEAKLKISRMLIDADPNNTQKQREHAVTLEKLGQASLALGKKDDALQYFNDELVIAERLMKSDPSDVDTKRFLSVVYFNLGDVCLELNRADEALAQFEAGLKILQILAERDRKNAGAQRDLSLAFLKLGDVYLKLGRTNDALTQFHTLEKLCRGFAEADPKRAENQRRLSISFERLGDVFLKLGRTDDALSKFQAKLKIDLVLAAADPKHIENQRNLSISFERLGDAFLTLGRTDDALAQYQAGLKIRRVLAEADPSQEQKQLYLSDLYYKLGDLFQKLGRIEDALSQFQAYEKVCRGLAEADPRHADRQWNLMVSHHKLGEAHVQAGQFDQAQERFAQGIAALDGMIAKGQFVEQSQHDKGILERRRLFCTVAPLATGDWDTLLKVDASMLPQLLKLRAKEMLKRGQFAEAVQTGNKLRELGPKDKINLYAAACIYVMCATSITNDKPRPTEAEQVERLTLIRLALTCLNESVAAGYDNFDYIRKDDELTALRGLPEFEALFAK